jgi:hypothetical protein
MKQQVTYWAIARLLLPVAVIGFLMIIYIFYKPHPEWNQMEPAYKLRAVDLLLEYRSNILKANSKYLNQVLSITGEVTSLEANLVIIDHGVTCTLDSTQIINVKPAVGKRLIVKGRCVGYDDLLEEVRMDHGFILLSTVK